MAKKSSSERIRLRDIQDNVLDINNDIETMFVQLDTDLHVCLPALKERVSYKIITEIENAIDEKTSSVRDAYWNLLNL